MLDNDGRFGLLRSDPTRRHGPGSTPLSIKHGPASFRDRLGFDTKRRSSWSGKSEKGSCKMQYSSLKLDLFFRLVWDVPRIHHHGENWVSCMVWGFTRRNNFLLFIYLFLGCVWITVNILNGIEGGSSLAFCNYYFLFRWKMRL